MSYEIGKMIRFLRRQQKMSQQRLADLVGVSRAHIVYIESGKHTPTTKTINAIADALGYRIKIKFEKKPEQGYSISN